MKKLKKTFTLATLLILVVIMGYSGYQLWYIYSHRAREQELHGQLLVYRPTPPVRDASTQSVTTPLRPAIGQTAQDGTQIRSTIFPPAANQSVLYLQDSHPSVTGWVHVPNTQVDHPFVQANDNGFYLHRDINHNHSPAGTVFMDSRNCPDFSDFHTLIYGHNMRNGSMFGSLQNFINADFFEDNAEGYIFLPNQTYVLEIFAVAVIRPDDPIIYGLNLETLQNRVDFLTHVRRVSMHYRSTGASAVYDRFVTLSTCRNDAANSRIILVGVLR